MKARGQEERRPRIYWVDAKKSSRCELDLHLVLLDLYSFGLITSLASHTFYKIGLKDPTVQNKRYQFFATSSLDYSFSNQDNCVWIWWKSSFLCSLFLTVHYKGIWLVSYQLCTQKLLLQSKLEKISLFDIEAKYHKKKVTSTWWKSDVYSVLTILTIHRNHF